jgi:hypothetical protein
MEAIRLNAGLPLYESGHATHMYGPLLIVALAGVFRVAGLNLLAARMTMSILSFALAVFLSAILCRDRLRPWLGFAVLLLLGINFRTNLIFLLAQPDCVAGLFGIVALSFWIKQCLPIAIASFIGAMLFKQTAAVFALIPFVYVLFWKRPLALRELLLSLVPPVSILLALAAIRWFWPEMFHGMITVPASIKVYPERAPGIVFYLFATFPIFIVALVALFSKRRLIDERERWILSALLVLIPASVWTICKSGGSYNSLLFAYLAMAALLVARLDVIGDWLSSLSIQRAAAAATLITLTALLSFFLQFDQAAALLFARHGDGKYGAAVATARELGAISPQDPTIAYRASGYIGVSLFFELDAHAVNGNWPDELPTSILQEIARAKYVMAVRSYVPTPAFEHGLLRNSFHPLEIDRLNGSAYTVWAKTDR